MAGLLDLEKGGISPRAALGMTVGTTLLAWWLYSFVTSESDASQAATAAMRGEHQTSMALLRDEMAEIGDGVALQAAELKRIGESQANQLESIRAQHSQAIEALRAQTTQAIEAMQTNVSQQLGFIAKDQANLREDLRGLDASTKADSRALQAELASMRNTQRAKEDGQ